MFLSANHTDIIKGLVNRVDFKSRFQTIWFQILPITAAINKEILRNL